MVSMMCMSCIGVVDAWYLFWFNGAIELLEDQVGERRKENAWQVEKNLPWKRHNICEPRNVMVRLNLDKYNMHAEVQALHPHCTYVDSIEPLSYLRIEWWDEKDKHGIWEENAMYRLRLECPGKNREKYVKVSAWALIDR